MDEDRTEKEDQVLPDLLRGAWRALTARAMAELRLADALVEPGTAAEVSARIGADASALDRLLRTLAALGLVTFSDGRFGLTEAGHGLRSDVPGSDWGAIMMMAAPWTLATWQGLGAAVRHAAYHQLAFHQTVDPDVVFVERRTDLTLRSGQVVSMSALDRVRFRDGRIAELTEHLRPGEHERVVRAVQDLARLAG